jgi:hypothetical protein
MGSGAFRAARLITAYRTPMRAADEKSRQPQTAGFYILPNFFVLKRQGTLSLAPSRSSLKKPIGQGSKLLQHSSNT